eukprot:TRINITY_DN5291_c0_g1_i1.p1 TRINITY_DN5291_c0_g1~~TRINITY_DN5291_c0_g1_i1.p1  ORF type:complete len:467 (-),score=85.86 TRINITY_DN5291_c0_g1_i1:141-1541(-)
MLIHLSVRLYIPYKHLAIHYDLKRSFLFIGCLTIIALYWRVFSLFPEEQLCAKITGTLLGNFNSPENPKRLLNWLGNSHQKVLDVQIYSAQKFLITGTELLPIPRDYFNDETFSKVSFQLEQILDADDVNSIQPKVFSMWGTILVIIYIGYYRISIWDVQKKVMTKVLHDDNHIIITDATKLLNGDIVVSYENGNILVWGFRIEGSISKFRIIDQWENNTGVNQLVNFYHIDLANELILLGDPYKITVKENGSNYCDIIFEEGYTLDKIIPVINLDYVIYTLQNKYSRTKIYIYSIQKRKRIISKEFDSIDHIGIVHANPETIHMYISPKDNDYIFLWDFNFLNKTENLQMLTDSGKPLGNASFYLISSLPYGSMKGWNTEQKSAVLLLRTQGQPMKIILDLPNSFMVSGNSNRIRIWDTNKSECVREFEMNGDIVHMERITTGRNFVVLSRTGASFELNVFGKLE